MQQYFSHKCDGTDVQADWRRSCTYGRAPNAIDISQGSLTCPSYTDTGPTFFYSVIPTHRPFSRTRWGYGGRILDLNPRRPHGGRDLTQSYNKSLDTHRKIQKALWQPQYATKNFVYTAQVQHLYESYFLLLKSRFVLSTEVRFM